MKKQLFLMMMAAAAIALAGCKMNADNSQDVYETDDAPPYAASKKVWKIGNLWWSDAIHAPECNNPDDTREAGHKRHSYTDNTNTWHYYEWPYVNDNGSRLCPSPWRVPTAADASMLSANSSAAYLVKIWGLGGYIEMYHWASDKDEISELQAANAIWAAPDGDNPGDCLVYYYDVTGLNQPISLPGLEMAQLRCVK
jgi:hypothetical protein